MNEYLLIVKFVQLTISWCKSTQQQTTHIVFNELSRSLPDGIIRSNVMSQTGVHILHNSFENKCPIIRKYHNVGHTFILNYLKQ